MKRAGLFFSLWFALFVVGVFHMRRQVSGRQSAVSWPLPPFQMLAVSGTGTSPLGLKDLLGRPWLAGFIYTRCGGPCPLVSGKMAELQRTLPAEVRLVSFSVDPDHDTPDVLRRYGSRFGADPSRWIFVRGNKADLYKLIFEGFRLAMAEDSASPAAYRITHSTKLVLVDSKGTLRHFYDVNSEGLLQQIENDLAEIKKERA